MIRTKAILCDRCELIERGSRINIYGGGAARIGRVESRIGHMGSFGLAIVSEVPWDLRSEPFMIEVELVHDGSTGPATVPLYLLRANRSFSRVRRRVRPSTIAGLKPGASAHVYHAFNFSVQPLPAPGSYFFKVRIDGVEADHLGFEVVDRPSRLVAS